MVGTDDGKPVTTEVSVTERPFIGIRDDFDTTLGPASVPILYLPKVVDDAGGSICEGMSRFVDGIVEHAEWLTEFMARSVSIVQTVTRPGFFRGFRTQMSPYCQGRLVECVSETPCWSVVVDCRPNASSYQQFTVFKLTGDNQEKVWVPRGFLLGLLTPKYDITKGTDGQFTQFDYLLPSHVKVTADAPRVSEAIIDIEPEILLERIAGMYRESFNEDQVANYTLYGLLRTLEEDVQFVRGAQTCPFQDFMDETYTEWAKDHHPWYEPPAMDGN